VIVLDSHVLVWADGGERRLGRRARALIERLWGRGEVAVSALSFWELALQQNRGRLGLPLAVDQWRDALLDAGLRELPLDGAAGVRAVGLGGLPEDPVDRMIVATTLQHGAALVTADERLLARR
jgi:PIN domain nuclease of toxin-antitoxin system